MKKLICIFLFAIMLMFCFAGCGEDGNSTNDDTVKNGVVTDTDGIVGNETYPTGDFSSSNSSSKTDSSSKNESSNESSNTNDNNNDSSNQNDTITSDDVIM